MNWHIINMYLATLCSNNCPDNRDCVGDLMSLTQTTVTCNCSTGYQEPNCIRKIFHLVISQVLTFHFSCE